MTVHLLTDRELLSAVLDASDGLSEEESSVFLAARDVLFDDDGASLSSEERVAAEEAFERLGLKAPRRRRPGRAVLGISRPRPQAQARWWDGSDPSFHPLKPPGRGRS